MTIQNVLRPLVHRPFGILLGLFLLLAFTPPARAQLMEIVKDFEQPGTLPLGPLTLGNDGFSYGTTYKGGQNNEGTIFKMAVSGTAFQLLKSFQCGQATNGCLPLAGMIQGIDGFMYGTTTSGGVNDEGIVFKIATDGSGFSLLKSFQCGVPGNGCSPQVGLIQGTDGVLYGSTAFGGPSNGGTLFKLATDGSGFSLLNLFQCGVAANGCHPAGRLIQGNDGFLYGSTYNGGTNDQGTVFKIATNGSGFTLLKSFQCGIATNGCLPLAKLTQSSDQNLYGTTQSGGAYDEGVIFKIAPDGSGFALLKSFQCGESGSGCLPVSGVVQLGDGNLYGTTTFGGAKDQSVIFKIATDGTGFAVIDRFACDGDDGCKPEALLTLAADGYLYSTSSAGGKFAGGTIFRLRGPDNVISTGPTLTLDSSTVLRGSSVTASWSGLVNPMSRDWIGLYAMGAGNSSYLAWMYVSCSTTAAAAKASGSCGLGIPANLAGGKYELRLFANNGYSVLTVSTALTVNNILVALGLSVTPSTVNAGTLANMSWSGIATPSATDWIGLYAVGAGNSSYIAWMYVSCSATAAGAKVSGSCGVGIPANLAGGQYELRLFANNGYSVLTMSNGLTVTNLLALGPPISVTPSTVSWGTLANVSWSGIATPSATDWIGLYAVGAPNSPFWAWEYVSCTRTATTAKASGNCTFTIPGNPPPGNYNLRLFSNNGYSQLGTSNTMLLQ